MSELNDFTLQGNSLGIHGDDELNTSNAVAPPIAVSTIYKYNSDPDKLVGPGIEEDCYSRLTQPNTRRAEEILGKLHGPDSCAVLYSCGLAAFHAAMTYYNPKRVFIGDGYPGCYEIVKILQRNYGVGIHNINESQELIQAGDVIHLETPVNPTGLAFDISHYAELAHSKGAYLLVDSTFAPPPIQNPFDFGADMVMHSATKFFGGHSDLLAGVLVTKDAEIKRSLLTDRKNLGTICASLESWLLLRSLRTYHLRIQQQQANAVKVVQFLSANAAKFNITVYHSTLQKEPFARRQNGDGSPVFSIEVKDRDFARTLPSKLKLFHHSTSLGSVESLIEWRILTDNRVSDRVLRLSIGLENADDLIGDLQQAFNTQ